MSEETNAAVVRDLAARSIVHVPIVSGSDATPVAIVPEGYKAESLERLLLTPTRATGTVTLTTAHSFIDFVNLHAADKRSNIYARDDLARPGFVAVLNDHAPGNPVWPPNNADWRDFRAVYDCPISMEWRTWIGMNTKPMTQAQFAQFIEDNLPDIVEPVAAEMLEVSRSLEAKKQVDFKSAQRLSDGAQQFTYNESLEGTAGKGSLQVPEQFSIGIPVFNGGIGYKLIARLRYRIDGGKLQLWYDLLRPHKTMQDAFNIACADIAEKTKIKPFFGSI